MYHTVELQYSFTCIAVFEYILTRLGVNREEARQFTYNRPRNYSELNRQSQFISPNLRKQLGHTSHKMQESAVHNFKVFYGKDCFFINFQIDLNYLLTGSRTIDLFKGTKENLKKLCQRYQIFMKDLFPFPEYEGVDISGYYCNGELLEEDEAEYLNDFKYGLAEHCETYQELEKIYSLYHGYLTRVDFSENIKVDAELVPLYIILLNKSVHSKQLRRPKKSKSEWKCNSLYLCNDSTAVTAYDKHKEVCTRKTETAPEYKSSKGILRFEVQYKKDKMSKLREKYLTEEILSEDFSQKELSKTANQLLPHGDWYNKHYADKKINDTLKKESTAANKVIDFLELVQNSQSLEKGYENFTSTATDRTYQTRIKQLWECDVAPYLIPRHLYTKYGLAERLKDGMLPNPFKELQGICC